MGARPSTCSCEQPSHRGTQGEIAMIPHSFAAVLALAVVASLGLPSPVGAGEQVHSPLPGPGLDLPVDLDGDGTSTFPERYRFNLWLANGGNLAFALTNAKVVDKVLDLSDFFRSLQDSLIP